MAENFMVLTSLFLRSGLLPKGLQRLWEVVVVRTQPWCVSADVESSSTSQGAAAESSTLVLDYFLNEICKGRKQINPPKS